LQLRNKGRKSEQKPPKVPVYIVTFSDMVTLLLTFFVMLLTLAHVRDPELFNVGRDAFWSSVRGLGLGMLQGRKISPDFGKVKIKYFISESDEPSGIRTIDAKEEDIRRLFKEVTRSMISLPSHLVAKDTTFSVADISFPPDEFVLDEPAKKFLMQFAADLQENSQPKSVKLCVLGLAGDVKDEEKQWTLSARRAQAVSDFLDSILPKELQWPVYSWGAGAGGHWVSENSPVSNQSQILLAILRTDD
jgi:hypothetical protein